MGFDYSLIYVYVFLEPAPIATEYLTWHRTESSRSSSSRDPLGSTLKDNIGDVSNLFENFCMNSGSHASTLDRLYAWERKLYDEVKVKKISLIARIVIVIIFLFNFSHIFVT